MPDHAAVGFWVRRFLSDHLMHERGVSRNTQQSYPRHVLFISAVCLRPAQSCGRQARNRRPLAQYRFRIPGASGTDSKLLGCHKESEACDHPRLRSVHRRVEPRACGLVYTDSQSSV
jgi:hypothetical protein